MTAASARLRASKKARRGSSAKVHQGVGLEPGKSQTGGLTRAAEKIGATIGHTIGKMDSAVHSVAAVGAREMAAVAHEFGRLTKKLYAQQPDRRRTRSARPSDVVPESSTQSE